MSSDKKDIQHEHFETALAVHPTGTGMGRDDELKEAAHAQHLTMEDRAVALKMAQDADPGPPAASWRMVKFTLMVLVVCMCSGDSGFDGTVMSSVNSMPLYLRYFGLPAGGNSKTGVVFGAYTIGQVLAFLVVSWLPDKLGRRYGMFVGNCVLMVGAIITTFSQGEAMFVVGRIITGLGCTTAATSAKSYLAEITSPASRGRWMGLLNSFYYVGQILASGISIPFGRMQTDWSWRSPLMLQALPAILNAAFILFLPESPRWLYTRGRKEQAIEILARLHSKDMDINSPLIKLEIEEIEVNISVDGSDQRWWDFRALFNTFGNRYRFGLCVMVSCWGQLSGNGLITYFMPILLLNAGITNSDRQRVLNFVNSITSFTGALTGTAIVDKVGRRFLLLFATTACTIGMFLVAGLLSPAGDTTSKMRADAGISFIFLFMVFFSFGWTPLQALYPAEVLTFENRAKGLALQALCTNSFSLINTFGLPSALAVLGWRTYLIFGAWDIVSILCVYFFAVETKQLSLEDIDEVFANRHPKRASLELKHAAAARARAEREERRQMNA